MTKSTLRVIFALAIFKISVFIFNLLIEYTAFYLENTKGVSIGNNINTYLMLFSCTPLLIGFPLYMITIRFKNNKLIPLHKSQPTNQYIIKRLLIIISTGLLISLAFTKSNQIQLNRSDLLNTILFTVILFPIMEELMFRRTLFEVFGNLGPKKYIIISTLLWAFIAHNIPINIIIALIAGFALLGPMYVSTNNTVLVIIFHCLINFIFAVLVPLISNFAVALVALITIIVLGLTIAYFYFCID
ncbi:MAG: hypothetical protein ATN31_09735 [Candidatus Epulonipiscioides saccharophilum]|nr:MAG: hypothetical protein ATN31_09735 [Epulopiscium sp. AS2M-Bin001]